MADKAKMMKNVFTGNSFRELLRSRTPRSSHLLSQHPRRTANARHLRRCVVLSPRWHTRHILTPCLVREGDYSWAFCRKRHTGPATFDAHRWGDIIKSRHHLGRVSIQSDFQSERHLCRYQSDPGRKIPRFEACVRGRRGAGDLGLGK